MDNLETLLDRWRGAGLIDAPTADRIKTFESSREGRRPWGVIIAVVFGCVMVGAGILLFVAAHWDDLSPVQRFALVIAMVASFHVSGGIFAKRSQYLSMALHFIGSAALGAGIFLAGQIFNLEEHWPGGILLWAIGVAAAWWLLGDWAQRLLLSVLAPLWLVGEWSVRVGDLYGHGYYLCAAFALMLAIIYLGAVRASERDVLRRSLMWVGGLSFFPLVFALAISAWDDARSLSWGWKPKHDIPLWLTIAGWVFAIGTPLLVGYLLRRERTAWHIGAALWVFGLAKLSAMFDPEKNVVLYLWCLIGSVAMIWWGVDDRRKERINLGMAAFAITLLCFYFSSVLDKFGRSTALIAMGLIFLVGGYYMERLRRRLVAHVKEATA